MKNLQVDDRDDDDPELANILDVLHTASDLIDAKIKKEDEFKESTTQLPFLEVGDSLSKYKIGAGFRVDENSNVSMSWNGDVKILNGGLGKTGRTKTVLFKYTSGFAWCYWTFAKIGEGGKELYECLRDYGTGVVKDERHHVLRKGVFLTKELSTDPAKFFTLAVMAISDWKFGTYPQLHNGMQLQVSQKEEDKEVFRIFRSCVPPGIDDVIKFHELINIRNENEGKLFWEM